MAGRQHRPLFNGAAGVIWALPRLHTLGAAALTRDFLPEVRGLFDRQQRDDKDLQRDRVPSFAVGDGGILLLH